jgi:cation diffusion facilitator CzcD-associated flavoprotein CzcO
LSIEGATNSRREEHAREVVVVGAGFAGMYMLHRLLQEGFDCLCLEAGAGVGGTWYWNRYPGARCDVPSLEYSYAFSEELQQEWEWSERYAAQPEIERYANHVADRLELRPHIRFETKIASAVWDAERSVWTLITDRGEQITTQHCVMAVGGYSVPVLPEIPGLDSFEGEMYHTAVWPREEIDYTDKRVGVIGTGASGMQVVQAVAVEPIDHLYVFQRTAGFVVPGGNGPLDDELQREYKLRYAEHRARARESSFGCSWPDPLDSVVEMSDSEFRAVMDEASKIFPGGPAILGIIPDLLTDEVANARVAEYFRENIREKVHDPEVAELLCTYSHHIGTRRILVENGYLDRFNQDNVSLVDVRGKPLTITRSGISCGDEQFELDMIVLATGFDSGTGAMLAVDFVGRQGRKLSSHWAEGYRVFLGVFTSGFPNMYMMGGPGSPSLRAQGILLGELQTEFLLEMFKLMREEGHRTVEATKMAEDQWTQHVQDVAGLSFVTQDDSQYLGANIPGKPRVYAAYLGGVKLYIELCETISDSGFTDGLVFDHPGPDVPVDPDWSGPMQKVTGVFGI